MLVTRYRKVNSKATSSERWACSCPSITTLLLIGITMMILGLLIVIVTFIGKDDGGALNWKSHFTYRDVDPVGYLLVTLGLLWCIGTFFRWIMITPKSRSRRSRSIVREASEPPAQFPPPEKACVLQLSEPHTTGDPLRVTRKI